jgi:regulator of protease activity HflC (stomatin/prohibitin superfamily)
MEKFVLGILLVILFVVLLVARGVIGARAKRVSTELEAIHDHDDRLRAQLRFDNAKSVSSAVGLAVPISLVLGLLLIAWSLVRVVPANNVGIPTNFGAIGSPLNSGLHTTAPWTEIHNFSTRVQELSMLRAPDEGDKTKDDSIGIIAKGGGSMAVDLTVRYFVQKEKADKLFRQAGTMDLIKETFVRPDAREVTRDVFGTYTAEEGYSSKRAEISVEIGKKLAPRLLARGIILDSVNVRDVAPESQVLNAINSILQSRNDALKAAEDQKKQVTEAETRKQVAERDKDAAITKAQADAETIRINAEAQAAANTQIAASLTPELSQLKIVQACADAIANTKAAVVNTCGGSGSASSGTATPSAASTVIVDGRAKTP